MSAPADGNLVPSSPTDSAATISAPPSPISVNPTTSTPFATANLVEAPTPSVLPKIESKLEKILFDSIASLEMRLQIEVDRGVIPLSEIHELGTKIHNYPFNDEEIQQLIPFEKYMKMCYELREQVSNKISQFSRQRYFQYSGFPDAKLSDKQRENLSLIIDKVGERIEAARKTIDKILSKKETQEIIGKIEEGQKEVYAHLHRIGLAIDAGKALMVKDEDVLKWKKESVAKISEASADLIKKSTSPDFITIMSDINDQLEVIISVTVDFPITVDMAFLR